MKKCKHCGKWFAPSHGLEVYCSIECRKQVICIKKKLKYQQKHLLLKKRRCKNCHVWFQPSRSYTKHCSIQCKEEYTKINRKLKREQNYKSLKKRRCKNCHMWFQPRQGLVKYCSKECQRLYYNQKALVNHKKRRCQWCHKWFKPRTINTAGCCLACQVALSSKKWRDVLKLKSVTYRGGKCCICGYNKCLAALEFHHKNPSKKDFTINKRKGIPWKTLQKELDKCDLLCANCHREVHHNDYSR
jgi:hypothetical protein